MKIVKSFEESGSLIKGVSETTKNDEKNKKNGFLSMLLVKYIRCSFIGKSINM